MSAFEMFTGFAVENIHLMRKLGVIYMTIDDIKAKISRSRRKISKRLRLIEYRLTVRPNEC